MIRLSDETRNRSVSKFDTNCFHIRKSYAAVIQIGVFLAVDSDLFIGESGNIRATVYAKNATISGQVTGNISCKERLELTSNAKVYGDIKCTTLIIAEGAVFRGKCAGFESYEEAAE